MGLLGTGPDPDPAPACCTLVALDPDTLEEDKEVGERRLQFWPETLQINPGGGEFSKTVGIGSPTGTHSWSSGDGMSVSFTMFAYRELDPKQESPSSALAIAGAVAGGLAGGGLAGGAAALAGAIAGPMPDTDWKESRPVSYDVNATLAWLYQFRKPKYKAGRLVAGPLAVGLKMPYVLLDPAISTPEMGYLFARMTELSVSIQAFFPSGAPRLAQMEVTLEQTMPWRSADSKFIVGRESFVARAREYKATKF